MPMFSKFIAFSFSKAIFLLLLAMLCFPLQATAQFYSDDFVEEDVWGSESEFIEEDPFGEDSSGFSQDYSEGGSFVDEERSPEMTIDGGVTVQSRRSDLRLREEQEILPLNIAWGAGTGLLIGGWFALIQNGDDRSTQRSIGMGIVLGTGIGAFLGMKALILPGSPQASLNETSPHPAHQDPPMLTAALLPGGMQLDFSLRF